MLYHPRPPPGLKTIESWLTHSDDDSHLEGTPRPPTAMTIFDDDASVGHSHSRPRRQTSYCSEADIIDVETPPRKQQKLGPAFVMAGSLSMGMNATPPSSSQTGGFTAIKAFSRPSLGVTHRDASSDDLPMISMDDEPHILGHPIQTSQRQLPFNPEDDGFHSNSQSRGGGRSGGYRGAFTDKPFQSHRRKACLEV